MSRSGPSSVEQGSGVFSLPLCYSDNMLEKLTEEIKRYVPFNEEEAADKALILSSLEKEEDLLLRINLKEHFTASSWIVSKDRKKVVMIYHRIYDSWAWTGGHADGEEDLLSVAMREATEETGLHVTPVSSEIFSLERLSVDGHYKKEKYVPTHMHLNLTYLLEADENEKPRIKEDENSGAQWFTVEDALSASTEEWMVEHIYKKLVARTKEF
ncbi:MAG: NUDIX hydrolase [Spirochaetales bacterium]|nr:NUDIX hydrolase [Candidatus Physcosoma equi]